MQVGRGGGRFHSPPRPSSLQVSVLSDPGFLPGLSIRTPPPSLPMGVQDGLLLPSSRMESKARGEEGSLPGGSASPGSLLSMHHSPCSAAQKIWVIRSLPCLETTVAFFLLRAASRRAVPFGEGAENQRQLRWERAEPGWCGGEQWPTQPRALPAVCEHLSLASPSEQGVCVCVSQAQHRPLQGCPHPISFPKSTLGRASAILAPHRRPSSPGCLWGGVCVPLSACQGYCLEQQLDRPKPQCPAEGGHEESLPEHRTGSKAC